MTVISRGIMHTIFINTSEKISEKLKENIYQDILFEELLYDKSLIIPELYVHSDPDDLKACAEKIAGQIDQEADINEDISLIIYMEVGDLPPFRSREKSAAYTIAYEILESLKIEKTLVWTLCDLGKRPKELIFVFGEETLRDPTLIDDKVLLNDIKQFQWDILDLPSRRETLNYLTGRTLPSEQV